MPLSAAYERLPAEPTPAARGAEARAEARQRRLVERAIGGSRSAFEELYRRFAPTVHGILLSLVPPQEAQDLVQEVFLRALRSIGRLDEPERFAPWLGSIARNCGRDLLRGRREPAEVPEDLPARSTASHEDADEAARVLAALRALPSAYRETLTLRLVEGLGGPEIAARTGLTPGSVRVNLCRGMKLLRESLGIEP